ncbi:alpha-2,3 sialyltransferase [Campylobacter coli]|nr:alpha-2,3 sialyltransferase [Campylobacter coli]EDP7841778.1 alpha-2,3 sialyltransferase [Campylobacter coli]
MQKNNVIIAGNGPSLKEIDYLKLPDDFDVFRCNQFYFEDKYYLGKKCKAVFYNPSLFFEQYYTLKHLIANQEYETELIICSNFNQAHLESENFRKSFYDYFPDAYLGCDFFKQLKEFDAYFKFHEIYLNQRITSGIYMCAVAIALGYKEIYLTGIDFYQNGSSYAFDTKQENLLKLAPNFKNDNSQYIGHNKNTDIKALEFLEKTYKINLYCLSPNSSLANFIEIAPNLNSRFIAQEKNNYTKDILMPPKEAYVKFSKNINLKKSKIKENIYFKIVKDLLRLPSDIKHYIKDNL